MQALSGFAIPFYATHRSRRKYVGRSFGRPPKRVRGSLRDSGRGTPTAFWQGPQGREFLTVGPRSPETLQKHCRSTSSTFQLHRHKLGAASMVVTRCAGQALLLESFLHRYIHQALPAGVEHQAGGGFSPRTPPPGIRSDVAGASPVQEFGDGSATPSRTGLTGLVRREPFQEAWWSSHVLAKSHVREPELASRTVGHPELSSTSAAERNVAPRKPQASLCPSPKRRSPTSPKRHFAQAPSIAPPTPQVPAGIAPLQA